MHIHMYIWFISQAEGEMSIANYISGTLADHRGICPVVTRVSLDPIVRTLPHTLFTTSTVQIIDVDGPCTLSVATLSTDRSCKED